MVCSFHAVAKCVNLRRRKATLKFSACFQSHTPTYTDIHTHRTVVKVSLTHEKKQTRDTVKTSNDDDDDVRWWRLQRQQRWRCRRQESVHTKLFLLLLPLCVFFSLLLSSNECVFHLHSRSVRVCCGMCECLYEWVTVCASNSQCLMYGYVCVCVIIYILSYFCITEERIWKIWKYRP